VTGGGEVISNCSVGEAKPWVEGSKSLRVMITVARLFVSFSKNPTNLGSEKLIIVPYGVLEGLKENVPRKVLWLESIVLPPPLAGALFQVIVDSFQFSPAFPSFNP
jgi:hypothetical protein